MEQSTSRTHDFADGFGPVPAHRHPLGGGWIADTAHVDPTAYVDKRAKVYGRARVPAYTRVLGRAKVHSTAPPPLDLAAEIQARLAGLSRSDARKVLRACGKAVQRKRILRAEILRALPKDTAYAVSAVAKELGCTPSAVTNAAESAGHRKVTRGVFDPRKTA